MSISTKKDTTLHLSSIQIPGQFIKTMPRREKIEAVIDHIRKHGSPDKPIKVHPKTMMLVDGYARYLAAKEMCLKAVPVVYGTKPDPSPPKKKRAPKKKPVRLKKRRRWISDETILAVWEAEDGRCEVCKRPMDKRMARWKPVNPDKIKDHPDAIHLACMDCFKNQPDFLMATIKVKEGILRALKERASEPPENLEEWFTQALREYGVLVGGGKNKDHYIYWLPGVGSFYIRSVEDPNSPFPVREVYKRKSVIHGWVLKEKPQERTRGLPKPAIRL